MTIQEVVSVLENFLQITDLPQGHKDLTKDFTKIFLSEGVAFAFVNTFLVLFLLELITFVQLGIIIGIRFAVLSILDFPTGALGDYIGYGKVLRIAYTFLILSTITLSFSFSFFHITIGFILLAIGSSQLSGALDSWLDNNYRNSSVDPDKKIYGAFKGRIQLIRLLLSGFSFILGGLIAHFTSYRILIFIHSLMLFFTLYLIIKKVEIKKMEGKLEWSNILSETGNNMKTSLIWLRNRPTVLSIFIGFSINRAIGAGVWVSLILFPFYQSYAKTDLNIGILRASTFLLGSIWVYFAPYFSKKSEKDYFPAALTSFFAYCGFYLMTFTFSYYFPVEDNFNLYTFLGIIFLFHLPAITGVLSEVFFSRIVIKTVPDEIRNTMYSLFNTLVTSLVIPFSIIGGFVIQYYNLSGGMIFAAIISGIGISIMFNSAIMERNLEGRTQSLNCDLIFL